MKKTLIFLALLMVIVTTQAWAICGALDSWIDGKSQSDSYPEKFVGLILDGVHRVVESPYEILYHPYDDISNKGERWTGLFTGLGKGLYYAGENIVVAAVNIVSAPVPGAKGYIRPHDHTLFGGKTNAA